MLSFILRRLAVAIPTILLLVVVSFVIMEFSPGSPFATERGVDPRVLANLEAKYGLNEPLWKRMALYVWNITTAFDFGPSFTYKDRTVNDIIAQGFPVTLTYGFLSFILAVLVGVVLGTFAAIYRNSVIDYFAVGITVGAQVLPNFVMAPILVVVFTLGLGWLPGGGWQGGIYLPTCTADARVYFPLPWGGCLRFDFVIMPVIALATSYMASIARIMRASMLEVLNADFVRTARAKGLSPYRIVVSHVMKPSLLPVISYLGPAFVGMITGSVVVDVFFSTGGIGKLFVESALNRDYSVIMGITVLTGVLTVGINLLVDVAYAWIDPKIRYD